MKRIIPLLLMAISMFQQADSFRGFEGIPGRYCLSRQRDQCCASRSDDCTVPILHGQLCYCDQFCRRPHSLTGDDCCPDWYALCQRANQRPALDKGCVHPLTKVEYKIGERVRVNCHICTCKKFEKFQCENRHIKCAIDEEIISNVNNDWRTTWRAANYSEFWRLSWDELSREKLGTLLPDRYIGKRGSAPIKVSLPANFDSRVHWKGEIQPILDQDNCAASWAFSTAATASDRLAISVSGRRKGRFVDKALSVQQMISCCCGQEKDENVACRPQTTNHAWQYLHNKGLVSEHCYPYTGKATTCQLDQRWYAKSTACPAGGKRRRVGRLYRTTPPYQLPQWETAIMADIMTYGPVQATFRVPRDFYMYKSGVFKSKFAYFRPGERKYYHSVRILGWGVENKSGGRAVKYWLAANSWGSRWGENGYFRIIRGENHLDIERYVLAAMAIGDKRPRRRIDKF